MQTAHKNSECPRRPGAESPAEVHRSRGGWRRRRDTAPAHGGLDSGMPRLLSTGTLAIVDDLYGWWRMKQRAIGFPFSLSIRAGNRTRGHFNALDPEGLKALVAQNQDEMIARLTEGER